MLYPFKLLAICRSHLGSILLALPFEFIALGLLLILLLALGSFVALGLLLILLLALSSLRITTLNGSLWNLG
jgi:hypothetical protein